jgi:Na+-driven multidrug efflux pump
LGKGDRETAGQIAEHVVIIALVLGGLVALTGALFSRQLIIMFNTDPELVRIGIEALKRISIGFLFVGPTIMSASIFQAIGRGTPSLIIGFLRAIVLLLPIMYVLGRLFGLSAAWYAFPIAELLTFLFAFTWMMTVLRKLLHSLEGEPA